MSGPVVLRSNGRAQAQVERSNRERSNSELTSVSTGLQELIEERKWDSSIERCKLYPSEIIVTDRFGRLPIHNAFFERAPLSVIKSLHEAHPDGIRTKNNNGWLPIHQACSCGASLEVIQYVYKAYPEGMMERNRYGCMPIHYACWEGASLEVIQFLDRVYPLGVKTVTNDGSMVSLAFSSNPNPNTTTSQSTKHVAIVTACLWKLFTSSSKRTPRPSKNPTKMATSAYTGPATMAPPSTSYNTFTTCIRKELCSRTVTEVFLFIGPVELVFPSKLFNICTIATPRAPI